MISPGDSLKSVAPVATQACFASGRLEFRVWVGYRVWGLSSLDGVLQVMFGGFGVDLSLDRARREVKQSCELWFWAVKKLPSQSKIPLSWRNLNEVSSPSFMLQKM